MGTSLGVPIECYDGEDHPHAYGDKEIVDINAEVFHGSSPRVWGQVIDVQYVIPHRMDHPHAYGDKLPHHSANSHP